MKQFNVTCLHKKMHSFLHTHIYEYQIYEDKSLYMNKYSIDFCVTYNIQRERFTHFICRWQGFVRF